MTPYRTIIDSHQHFWHYNDTEFEWINTSMYELKKNFLPDELDIIYAKNNICGCVAVQARQCEQENAFLLKEAEHNPWIKGVVGWIDFKSEYLQKYLEKYSGNNMMKGFRHILQSEKDEDYLSNKKFLDGISLLQQYNMTYDILIKPSQMELSNHLVNRFPNQKFVLDHLAKPDIEKGEITDWRKSIERLSKCENVYCKISGMTTEANLKNWKYEDFVPYLDVVVEKFGVSRIMFGSDWPVCLLASSYTSMLNIITTYFEPFSNSERDLIMGANAIKFYNLKI